MPCTRVVDKQPWVRGWYQSIPSLTFPPGQTPGEFCETTNSSPPGTKKVRNPDSWGRIIVPKLHPRGNSFQKSSNKQNMNETEIIKKKHYCLIACLYAKCCNLIGWIMERGPSIHFRMDGLDSLYST